MCCKSDRVNHVVRVCQSLTITENSTHSLQTLSCHSSRPDHPAWLEILCLVATAACSSKASFVVSCSKLAWICLIFSPLPPLARVRSKWTSKSLTYFLDSTAKLPERASSEYRSASMPMFVADHAISSVDWLMFLRIAEMCSSCILSCQLASL